VKVVLTFLLLGAYPPPPALTTPQQQESVSRMHNLSLFRPAAVTPRRGAPLGVAVDGRSVPFTT